MKKLFSLLVTISLVFVFAACAPQTEDQIAPSGEVTESLDADLDSEAAEELVFQAVLESVKEVPPVVSSAQGSATARLVGNTLTVTGTFQGFSDDAEDDEEDDTETEVDTSMPLMAVSGSPAHIHRAPEGENGPIIFNLEVITEQEDQIIADEGYDPSVAMLLQDDDDGSGLLRGEFELTDDQVEALINEDFYINIHTEQYPSGEIRGQLVQVIE